MRLCIKRSSDDEYEKLFERMKQIRRGNRGPDVKNARLKEEEEVTSDVYTGGITTFCSIPFISGRQRVSVVTDVV